MKLMKRDLMSGQEKYESDKDRKQVEDLVKENRDRAKAMEEEAGNSEKTAKYFHGLAESNRSVAEKVRRVSVRSSHLASDRNSSRHKRTGIGVFDWTSCNLCSNGTRFLR